MLRALKLTGALVAALATAGCDDDDPLSPSTTAQLRVVHASPDAPAVDVLVDNAAVLTNVPFKAASTYLSVPSGSRNLKVRAAGGADGVIGADANVAGGGADRQGGGIGKSAELGGSRHL